MAEIPELKRLSKLSIGELREQESAKNYTKDEQPPSHSTLALHGACENGNVGEVRDILAEGRADLNALIAGHRALRTALHKASAYGHTEVVKLLLKVMKTMRFSVIWASKFFAAVLVAAEFSTSQEHCNKFHLQQKEGMTPALWSQCITVINPQCTYLVNKFILCQFRLVQTLTRQAVLNAQHYTKRAWVVIPQHYGN